MSNTDSEKLRDLADWIDNNREQNPDDAQPVIEAADLRRIASEYETLNEEVSRLRDAYNGIFCGADICLSPIMAERERQISDLKEILIGYPNGAPGWQYMNGLIAIAKEKREAPSDDMQRIDMIVKLTLARLEFTKLKYSNQGYDWAMTGEEGQKIITKTLVDIDFMLNYLKET